MNAPRTLLAVGLLLLTAACSSSPEANRDKAIQAGLDGGRLACQMLLSDPSIQRDKGVDEYCRRVVTGECGDKP